MFTTRILKAYSWEMTGMSRYYLFYINYNPCWMRSMMSILFGWELIIYFFVGVYNKVNPCYPYMWNFVRTEFSICIVNISSIFTFFIEKENTFEKWLMLFGTNFILALLFSNPIYAGNGILALNKNLHFQHSFKCMIITLTFQ